MSARKLPLFATAVSLMAMTTLGGCSSTAGLLGGHSGSDKESREYKIAYKTASEARSNGDMKTAVSGYMRAADLAPEETAPLIALAETLWSMKSVDQTIKVLERARAINSEDATVLNNLGRAYVAKGEAGKAQEVYLAALAIDPNSTRTLNGLGIAYGLSNDYKTAESHYKSGLALEPNNPDLINNYAFMLITTKRYDEAIDLLAPAVKAVGATQRQRQNLALAYGLAGREAEAKEVAAADLSPAEIARNIKRYRQIRNEPGRAKSLLSLGRPTLEKGNLSKELEIVLPRRKPTFAEDGTVTVKAPKGPTTARLVSSTIMGTPQGATVKPATPAAPEVAETKPTEQPTAPAPVDLTKPLPAVIEPPKQEPKEEPKAEPKNEEVAKPVETPKAVEPIAEPKSIEPVEAPKPALPPVEAPKAAALEPPRGTGAENSKIYLGTYPSEPEARETWIRVWTGNSSILGSLVASIEPDGNKLALYAVGLDSPAKAEEVCNKLRALGISCGAGK